MLLLQSLEGYRILPRIIIVNEIITINMYLRDFQVADNLTLIYGQHKNSLDC